MPQSLSFRVPLLNKCLELLYFAACRPVSRNRVSPELAYLMGYSISIPIYPPPRKITTDGKKVTGIRQYLETCISDNWMPQSKFKTIKYTGKAIVLSYLSQLFQSVVR